MKKGQGALEYLMSYSWAIIIVIIIGLALWGFGVFSAHTTTPTFIGFSKIKPQTTSVKLSTAGDFEAVFVNGIGSQISGITAGVYNKMDKVTCTPNVSATFVSRGDHLKISATDCKTGSHKTGETYEVYVNLTYTVLGIGSGMSVSQADSGTIRGSYE
ncbi:MAG: hypothetical protein FJY77_04875 [Candidatus Altiarchaeales archaeon]|nr:hypothetical protein [Candidatus Altiarchaeales archaeon]